MTPAERTTLLNQTISAVLGIPASEISQESSPDTISKWDSVAHLNLVMAVEEAFGVTFTPEEALDLTSVKLIQLLLEEKAC